MTRYTLSKSSFVCESGDHAVFLDLKRDRYVALPPEDIATLRLILACVSDEQSTCDSCVGLAGRQGELARLLEREGLIVEGPASGRDALISTVVHCEDTYWRGEGEWPRLRAAHFWRFVAASVSAALLLKLQSIESIVRRVRERKASRVDQSVVSNAMDVRALVHAYYVIQPVFYSVPQSCLLRSLTMIEFLARFDQYPTWVFGVQVQPFGAHCWLQQENVVLNDSLDHVAKFTPIMAV